MAHDQNHRNAIAEPDDVCRCLKRCIFKFLFESVQRSGYVFNDK